MKWYLYPALVIAIFLMGWSYRGEYDAKEKADAIHEAQRSYAELEEEQTGKRTALEKELVQTRKETEQRFGRLIAENSRLRAEAIAAVPVEFLVLGRLCDNQAECSLLYRSHPDQANPAPEGYSAITSLEIYRLLGAIDEAVIAHNLGLSQLQEQLNVCRGK